jgi:hypothetical protein
MLAQLEKSQAERVLNKGFSIKVFLTSGGQTYMNGAFQGLSRLKT